MKDEASEQKSSTAPTRSSVCPILLSGIRPTNLALKSASASIDATWGVSTKVGEMALTVIPYFAHSVAHRVDDDVQAAEPAHRLLDEALAFHRVVDIGDQRQGFRAGLPHLGRRRLGPLRRAAGHRDRRACSAEGLPDRGPDRPAAARYQSDPVVQAEELVLSHGVSLCRHGANYRAPRKRALELWAGPHAAGSTGRRKSARRRRPGGSRSPHPAAVQSRRRSQM